jgi:2-keto-4-pentenoate hydratase/2-oxohepta-3-ene-1,7-dioic acid hydratase in catechol pathway
MRLIRYGLPGEEKPGLWRDDRIIDLKSIFPAMPDIGEEFFREGWLEKVQKITTDGKRMQVRFGSPVCRPGKIICIGKNYMEHAKEGGFDIPKKPLLFAKASSSLTGPYDPILLPRSCGQVDWEVELAVVIGKEGKRIEKNNAIDYVAGVAVMNDVSGRQAQFSDSQWFRGKSFDTFAPMGPALVTLDEIDNLQDLRLTTLLDGQVMQEGSTADMIFTVTDLITYISEDITLFPGDIISTGTPSGVGIFRDPPVLLKAGNLIECRIEKVGSIINAVVSEE